MADIKQITIGETTYNVKDATTRQEQEGKADKVSNPTSGNFAALDSNGNLTDSGHKHSDYMGAMSIDTIPTANSSNLITSGGVQTALSQIVYDISANHLTNGQPTAYADLSAALGTNGANIPESIRRGGMTVKFVSTYDNKYVQYRLTKNTFSTTESDWQGVDELAKTVAEMYEPTMSVTDITSPSILKLIPSRYIKFSTGELTGAGSSNQQVFVVDASNVASIKVRVGRSDSYAAAIAFYTTQNIEASGYIAESAIQLDNGDSEYFAVVPKGCRLIVITNDDSIVATPEVTITQSLTLENKTDIEELHLVINGGTYDKYEETGVIESGKCYNATGIDVGGTFSPSGTNTLEGCACTKINVSAGEKYRIFGQGTSNAVALCVLTGTNNIVKEKIGSENHKNYPYYIDVEENGVLYVNFMNYALGDKLEKRDVVTVDSLTAQLEDLDEDVTEIDNVLNGYTQDSNVPITYTDKYFKTDSLVIGETYDPSPTSGTGLNCIKVAVTPGQVYKISGKGQTNLVNLCVLTGNGNKALSNYKGNTREEPTVVNITQNGYLYVNYVDYDSTTDKVIVTNPVAGLIEKVGNLETTKELSGKRIVCFGDSLSEINGADGKNYPSWLSEISGATVVNVGVGGTQFRERTTPVLNPTTSSEGYAGLDIINMVRAACGVQFDSEHSYLEIAELCAEYVKTEYSDDNTEIIERLAAINWADVDAVIFFAGTNDWNNGVGNWGESGSNNVNTTMGAINEIIRILLSTYKHLKLYWFTPIVRWIDYSGGTGTDSGWSDVATRSGGGQTATLKQFSKMIQDEVVLNHIPVCDLYNTLGINKSNFSQYFNNNDGTHPAKGYKMIAMKIASFIVANKTF